MKNEQNFPGSENQEQNFPGSEIQALIAGFFSSSLCSDDLKRLNDWLAQDPSHIELFNRMRSAWILGHHQTGKKNFNADTGWQLLKQRIKNIRKLRFAQWMTPMRYAASIALCISLTAAVTILARSRPVIEVVNRHVVEGEESAVFANTTVQMPLGSKSKVTLPDGSTVWLNAGSTLTYPADFGMDARALQLIGEAFFDVKSDSLTPFLVQTVGMTVRAKGTRFNVKAYPDDEMLIATLEEGRLDVLFQASDKDRMQEVTLSPNQQFVVWKSQTENSQAEKTQTITADLQPSSIPKVEIKSRRVIPNVKTELATSWKDPQWIVADEPLHQFAAALERRYNLNIQFESDELKNYKITGTFENETVEQIIRMLSLAAPVDYQINKNQVTLSLNKAKKDKFQRTK